MAYNFTTYFTTNFGAIVFITVAQLHPANFSDASSPMIHIRSNIRAFVRMNI